jgi:hypothetical protein
MKVLNIVHTLVLKLALLIHNLEIKNKKIDNEESKYHRHTQSMAISESEKEASTLKSVSTSQNKVLILYVSYLLYIEFV